MLKDGEKGAVLQKGKETYAIAPHVACGVITPENLRKLADVAEKYNAAALKITSAARIAVVGLKEEDIDNSMPICIATRKFLEKHIEKNIKKGGKL